MKWLARLRMMMRGKGGKPMASVEPAPLPPLPMTTAALARERSTRRAQRDRTERLARMLDDYRQQDKVLR